MPLTTVEGTPPRGRPSATPTASNAGPQGRTLCSRCWVPTPAPTASGTHGSRNRQLPAPEDGRPGEGRRLTPDTPHNGRSPPPPPGTAPHHPRGTQPPQGMQAKGTVLGPHTHIPAPTARGWRTPTARPVGGQSGEAQRLTTDAPHNGGRQPPPRTPFRHPRSEQRRPARAHAVEPVRGPHAHTDRTRNTRVAVQGLPAPEDGRSGEGRRLTPDAPHNGGRPRPPQRRPPTTPAARSPHRACRPSQVGGNRDRTTPPQARQTEQGTGAGHAGGHRPGGTALPAPSARNRAGCARHTTQGGRSGRRGSVSAHTRKGHAGTTRRATGPSSRIAQTAWNRVPASEGKGQPDGMARHKQRGTRGAGRGKRERHNTRYRPEPPEPAASAAHPRTGHCTRQGSSGALRHAPAPRLGSLRVSPMGSHWRQASSTGPAAPAPRATTH